MDAAKDEGRTVVSGMSFEDAMELAETMDLPDGAFWAMSHELAGLEYGDGFALLPRTQKPKSPKRLSKKRALMERPRSPETPHRCGTCGKDFASKGAKKRHRLDKHPRDGGAK
jgi:hypothetical protein